MSREKKQNDNETLIVVKKRKPPMPNFLKIIPLGGLDEIGMNMTIFEYKDTVVVVDCGVSFPDEYKPGVDYVVPDISYLAKNINKVKAMVITHGHEDHIGAIPWVLNQIDMPIYGARLTIELIKVKLERYHMEEKSLNIVEFGDTIKIDDIEIEFIKTNHSIQDSVALAIHTKEGTVIHTGDFKIDHTPIYGDSINLLRFATLGQKGVLAMLCDSTNAEKAGSTMPEITVGHKLEELFKQYKDRRILISTFASNVDRVHQIIDCSIQFGRKIVIDGTSMNTIIGVACELGYIDVSDNVFIDMSEIDKYPHNKVTIIMTGSQGEPMAALTKYAKRIHLVLSPSPTDVVIFSAHPIPGNEKAVRNVVNTLVSNGVEVVHHDVHVSGHACAEDIKLLYSLVKPKYAIPIHGDIVQRKAQAEIVKELGYDSEHIKIIETGDVLKFHKGMIVNDDLIQVDKNSSLQKVKAGTVLVDSDNFCELNESTINIRNQMSSHGMVIVSVTYSQDFNKILLAGPEISYIGFTYTHYGEDMRNDILNSVIDTIKIFNDGKYRNFEVLKRMLKDNLKDTIWELLKAKPVIMPIISFVE